MDSPTLDDAVAAYRDGRLPQAAEICREIGRRDPCDGDALNLLGAVLLRQGRPAEAEAAFAAAVRLRPQAKYLVNLGAALTAQQRWEEAAAAYRRALAEAPGFTEAWANLGNLFLKQRRWAEAADALREALRINPATPRAAWNLGTALLFLGRPDEALAVYGEAVAREPAFAEGLSNMGLALQRQGRLEEAIAAFRQAAQHDPAFAPALCNLGHALQTAGLPEEALPAYRRALELVPGQTEALVGLANALLILGRADQAMRLAREALDTAPGDVLALNTLGKALQSLGDMEEALACYRQAFQSDADHPETLENLGGALGAAGLIEQAEPLLRRAAAVSPTALSTLATLLHYFPQYGNADFLALARPWGAGLAAPAPARPPGNLPDPRRRLRIGYLSGDFKRHPVGYFLERVFQAHCREAVAIHCYSTDAAPGDGLTARLRASAEGWRSLAGLPDAAAAEVIRADGIDILVDLAGHTVGNRLTLFAHRPAPVQVSWLGYFGTTGVPQMDYILADRHVVADGEREYFTETVWMLPDSYLCFSPPDMAAEVGPIDVGPLPAMAAGGVTFGCFNNRLKVRAETIALWARVLEAVAGSRLLLKSRQYQDQAVRQDIAGRFAAHGIAPDRILFEGHAPRAELLASYNRVDIALDPFPFGGGTTTAEALWMGVPVVTLRGDRWVGRVSESILRTIGDDDLVAGSPDAYVAIAAALAGDRPALARRRAALRPRLLSSPLCDGARFTCCLERAFRSMWEAWCAGAPVPTSD